MIPTHIQSHLKKDTILAPYIHAFCDDLPKIVVQNDLYRGLVSSVISQQLSSKAAEAIETKFKRYFGGSIPDPIDISHQEIATLRSLGLSNAKSQYIKNIAHYWNDNKLQYTDWSALSNEEIITLLTKIQGVGRWTVQMVLIFLLGRDDVFPYEDLGVRNGLAYVYHKKTQAKTFKIWAHKHTMQYWSPYRSWGSRLIWKAYDSRKLSPVSLQH